MTEVPEPAVAAGRRHIIKRPRLTRLLDETTARVILLVAPAGYGKTTLAREWLARRPGTAWSTATTQSADVAAFASGIARAVASTCPGVDGVINEHLRLTQTPIGEGRVLAEILARELRDWPDDAWICVDDYHLVTRAAAPEEFFGSLVELSKAHFLVASRLRPKWRTARRLVYGEVFEIDHTRLAMTPEEGQKVLGRAPSARSVVDAANGWPAIIGLAAAADEPLPEVEMPQALHDYLAEELLHAAASETRGSIARLSLVPGTLTVDLADVVLGKESRPLLSDAERLGFITPRSQEEWEMHPLIRSFLQAKLRVADSAQTARAAEALARKLLSDAALDAAFDVIASALLDHLVPDLLDRALPLLLQAGRLETLREWLDHFGKRRIASPLLDLARAELAARDGSTARSDIHAARAFRQFGHTDPHRTEALLIHGRNAIMGDRYDQALLFYQEAQHSATTLTGRRAALWGEFVSRRYLEQSEIDSVISELARIEDNTAEAALRIANGRFQAHCVVQGEIPSLDEMLAASELVSAAEDPHVVTSFLQQLAYGLALIGRYEEALVIARDELRTADKYRLRFVVPSALATIAFGELGLGNFTEARGLFDDAGTEAEKLHDLHNILNVRVGRARILLAYSEPAEALRETPYTDLFPSPGMYAEYQATRAIALACLGRVEEALKLAAEAERISRSLEAHSTAACARAIAALNRGDGDPADAAQTYLAVTTAARHVDGFITAYRAFHPLLAVCARSPALKDVASEAVRAGRDGPLALAAGLWLPEPGTRPAALTPREREVLHLVARGATNREAAETLYISEATVKVHLHHIFEKLGVRSRTEAALRAATTGTYAAPRSRRGT